MSTGFESRLATAARGMAVPPRAGGPGGAASIKGVLDFCAEIFRPTDADLRKPYADLDAALGMGLTWREGKA